MQMQVTHGQIYYIESMSWKDRERERRGKDCHRKSTFRQKRHLQLEENDPHLSVSPTMPPRCRPRIIKHHTQTPEISSPRISLVKQNMMTFCISGWLNAMYSLYNSYNQAKFDSVSATPPDSTRTCWCLLWPLTLRRKSVFHEASILWFWLQCETNCEQFVAKEMRQSKAGQNPFCQIQTNSELTKHEKSSNGCYSSNSLFGEKSSPENQIPVFWRCKISKSRKVS